MLEKRGSGDFMDTLHIQIIYNIFLVTGWSATSWAKNWFPKSYYVNKKYGSSKKKKKLPLVVNTTFVDCREVFGLEIHPEHEDEHLGVAGTDRHGDTHSTGTHVDDECDWRGETGSVSLDRNGPKSHQGTPGSGPRPRCAISRQQSDQRRPAAAERER